MHEHFRIAGIPVAAGVLVPFGGPGLTPVLAALIMAFSSVLVVTNALRLRRVPLGQRREQEAGSG